MGTNGIDGIECLLKGSEEVAVSNGSVAVENKCSEEGFGADDVKAGSGRRTSVLEISQLKDLKGGFSPKRG